ncbi:MAG: 3'-5' exonuclease, partial [Candidatus Humimicrobiaceae bacterium]
VKPENETKKSSVIFFKTNTLHEEAEQISRLILGFESKNHKLKDIAVLCRKKRFNEIIKSFRHNNIRYEVIGSKSYFYEPEILFLVSWMKIINEPSDDESVLYLLKSSKFKISDRDILFLRNINNKKFVSRFHEGNTLINAIHNSKISTCFEDETHKRLEQFLSELTYYIKNSELISLNSLINLIFHNSGLYDELNSRFGIAAKKKIRNVENLLKLAWDFEANNFNPSFESFIVYLRDIAKTDYEDPDFQSISKENSVKLMSIHAAKGLEFKTVFLPMLWESDYKPRKNQKNFYDLPSALRKDGKIWNEKSLYENVKSFEEALKSIIMEEERRIFYVAGSRAKETLILSFPHFENDTGVYKEERKEKNILSFVNEIFNENTDVMFFGENTASYLRESFNIKPKIFIKNEADFFKKVLYGSDENNRSSKTHKLIAQKNSRAVSCTDPGSYENILAKSIGDLKAGLTGCDYDIALKLKKSLKKIRKKNINFFSLTEILTFIECPVLYKYKHIINIPEAQSDSVQIGIKIHKFIENLTLFCYKSYSADLPKENSGQSEIKNNPALKFFNNKNNQKPKLKSYIKNFIKSGFLNFDSIKNIFTEHLFYWKINNYFLTCKIDRINILKNGKVELFDFKTSGFKENKQKLIYINQIKSYICGLSDLIGIGPENIKGSIFYLKDGKKIDILVSESQKAEIIQKYSKTIKSIINKKYEVPDQKECGKYCDYGIYCNIKNYPLKNKNG